MQILVRELTHLERPAFEQRVALFDCALKQGRALLIRGR
jgi:hypothetical protein